MLHILDSLLVAEALGLTADQLGYAPGVGGPGEVYDMAIDLVCGPCPEAEYVAGAAADVLYATRDLSGRDRIAGEIARARRMLAEVAPPLAPPR